MIGFYRFPHIPHMAWLGKDAPREDKVLAPWEVDKLLSSEVVVEKKLDGANLGVSLDDMGGLQLQNRGQYLARPFGGQFSRAGAWLGHHEAMLTNALGRDLILFGEWCAARHTVAYDNLPDWFIAFDVYERSSGRFWSVNRRNNWAAEVGLPNVPMLERRRETAKELIATVTSTSSRFGARPLEGVMIRQDSKEYLEQRAKLVRPEFTQSIGEHWRNRRIEWNSTGRQ